jgi:hypothetical protein
MTILNSASEGLPNELIVLSRAAFEFGPITRDELVELCRAGDVIRLKGCLSKWTTIGLFDEDVDGKTRLSSLAGGRRGESVDAWTDRLPAICRRLALSPANTMPLFGKDPGVSADLAKGLSWLLAQNIFELPTVWRGGVSELEANQLNSDDQNITNDVRFNALRFWAVYLGFANAANGFFVDPTIALRQELSDMLKPNQAVSANVFVEDLARRMSVFDGGAVRTAITDKLRPDKWAKPRPQQLSISLSYALYRLELDQVIAFEAPSDTEQGFALLDKDLTERQTFIRIRLRADAA